MADDPPYSPLKPKDEWHSHGYIPHWEAGETAQSITFRLADSLPAGLRIQWQAELAHLSEEAWPNEQRKLIEKALDAGYGSSFLRRPDIGHAVEDALLYFDNKRYRLHATCIMPNHVHVLATPLPDHFLSSVVHSWKSFTANRINEKLGRTGQVWFQEYYDRKIRTERHFEVALHYIEQNPVKARLCDEAKEWPFSSASRR